MQPLFRPLAREPRRSQWLLTDDGVRISAHHDPAAKPAADAAVAADGAPRNLAIVTAHGFTMSWRSPASRRIALLLQQHAGVISFDFRGHGASKGHSTVGDKEILDLDAAVSWARTLGYRRVATLGWSMGSAVVVRHAGLREDRIHDPDAVVAISGPSRWHYTGTQAMRRLDRGITTPAGRAVVRYLFGTRVLATGWEQDPSSPEAAAARIAPTPFLIVHGDDDPYFPLDHAEALHAASREGGAELWVEPGFGHAEMAASDDLVHRIATWISAQTR